MPLYIVHRFTTDSGPAYVIEGGKQLLAIYAHSRLDEGPAVVPIANFNYTRISRPTSPGRSGSQLLMIRANLGWRDLVSTWYRHSEWISEVLPMFAIFDRPVGHSDITAVSEIGPDKWIDGQPVIHFDHSHGVIEYSTSNCESARFEYNWTVTPHEDGSMSGSSALHAHNT